VYQEDKPGRHNPRYPVSGWIWGATMSGTTGTAVIRKTISGNIPDTITRLLTVRDDAGINQDNLTDKL